MSLDAADRAALADLVHRYAAYVDDRQFDSAAELFSIDAELVLPDPPTTLQPVRQHRGRAAINDALLSVAATVRTQHSLAGEVYDAGAQPDSALGRITCVAHHWAQHNDEIRDVVWYLRYDDQYRRSGAGWQITRRILTIDAIETRQARQVRH